MKFHKREVLGLLAKGWLRRISMRTWLVIGAVLVLLCAALVWLGVTLAAALWAQVPAAANGVERLTGGLAASVQQAVPAAREQVDTLVSDVTAEAQGLLAGGGALAGAAQWLADGAQPQIVTDVSGEDPLPRYPGLIRSAFKRTAEGVEVVYRGTAATAAVVEHYRTQLVAAGYQHQVMSATIDAEEHQFTRAEQRISLQLARPAGQALEVRLKQQL